MQGTLSLTQPAGGVAGPTVKLNIELPRRLGVRCSMFDVRFGLKIAFQNPPKSPFAKGDFISPLRKRGAGRLSDN